MRLPDDYDPYLIDGLPWGLGAIRVDDPPKGWVCPHCNRKTRKDDGRHFYVDDDVCCTPCARAWIEAQPLVGAPDAEKSRPSTGAEQYFAKRMDNPTYAKGYRKARAEVDAEQMRLKL